MEKEKRIGKPKTAIFVFKDFLGSQGMSTRNIMKVAYRYHKDEGTIGKLAMAVLMEAEPIALRYVFPGSVFSAIVAKHPGGDKFHQKFGASILEKKRRTRIKAAAEWKEIFFKELKEIEY